MKLKTGLGMAMVVMALGVSSLAMPHARDRQQGVELRRTAWHDEHERKGVEKGKKKGWDDGTLPAGQAKKESKEWRREHKRESKEHRREAHEQRYRYQSHPTLKHKQPKPVNAHKPNLYDKIEAAKQANKEHRQEAPHKK